MRPPGAACPTEAVTGVAGSMTTQVAAMTAHDDVEEASRAIVLLPEMLEGYWVIGGWYCVHNGADVACCLCTVLASRPAACCAGQDS